LDNNLAEIHEVLTGVRNVNIVWQWFRNDDQLKAAQKAFNTCREFIAPWVDEVTIACSNMKPDSGASAEIEQNYPYRYCIINLHTGWFSKCERDQATDMLHELLHTYTTELECFVELALIAPIRDVDKVRFDVFQDQFKQKLEGWNCDLTALCQRITGIGKKTA